MNSPQLAFARLHTQYPTPANFIADSINWGPRHGNMLDDFLQQGWFRSQGTMFVTYFMYINNDIHSIVPLRIELDKFEINKSVLKRLRKMEEFSFSIVPFYPDAEFYALLQEYENYETYGYQWEQFESYRAKPPIFNTQAVQIRHEGRLVACGLFDLGHDAVMGLLNIYLPEYSRFSPGRLLISTKLTWARQHRYKYFYPGYFVPGYAKFDYKLRIAPEATEFIDFLTGEWRPLSEKPATWPAETIRNQLENLHSRLRSRGRVMFLTENRQASFVHPVGILFNTLEWPLYLSEYCLSAPEEETIISYNPLKNIFEESEVMWIEHPFLIKADPGEKEERMMLVQRTKPFDPDKI